MEASAVPAGSAAPALVGQAFPGLQFVLPLRPLALPPGLLLPVLPVDNGGPFKDIPPLAVVNLLTISQRVHGIP